jgi:hypothetical protein
MQEYGDFSKYGKFVAIPDTGIGLKHSTATMEPRSLGVRI